MQEIKKQKTVSDVRGYKKNCINFLSCPLCYGCRRYSSIDQECEKCYRENKKYNICNKDLHKDDLIGKMISKNRITRDDISFKNYSDLR